MESQKFTSIKHWAEDDRPREKMLRSGSKSLTDAELLAIIIHSGSRTESAVDLCRRILNDMKNDLNVLARKSIRELMQYKGIGEAKAISIAAAMELVNRKKFEKITERKISGSRDVYEEMYSQLAGNVQEEFWVIYLDRKNSVIDKRNISKGGVNATVVDPRIIFKHANELLASGLILVHNHPSENRQPSEMDISITNKIKNGASFFDMNLLDHVIFAGPDYFSFADEGLI
ncbi:MAG: RadC family protein [Deltaproteobacteria bacterium]